MSVVLTYLHDGYNCAEAMVHAINETFEININPSLASPFGVGMGIGSTCGAVTGAVMVLGAYYGRTDSNSPQKALKIAHSLTSKVIAKYGTLECRKLMKQCVSCEELLVFTYDVLVEHIEKNQLMIKREVV